MAASVAAVYLAMEKGITFALGTTCYLAAALLAQELWRRRPGQALWDGPDDDAHQERPLL